MRLSLAGLGLLAALAASGRAAAETAAEAFFAGCGGCHAQESRVISRLKGVKPAERRAWIEHFMSLHPCERDSVRALIVDYLLQRSQ